MATTSTSTSLDLSLHLPGTLQSASTAVVETIAILPLASTTLTATAVASTTGVVVIDGTTLSWRHPGITVADGVSIGVAFDGIFDSTTTVDYQATTVLHPTYVGSAPSVSEELPLIFSSPPLLQEQQLLPRSPANPSYSYTPTSFSRTLRTTAVTVSKPVVPITIATLPTTSLTGLTLTSASTSAAQTTSTSTSTSNSSSSSGSSSSATTTSSSSVLTLTGTNRITLPGTASGLTSTATTAASSASAASSSASSASSAAAAAPDPRMGAGKTLALLAALCGVIVCGL